MPKPYYLHLSWRDYARCWQDFKDYFENDDGEAIQRPMRAALKRMLEQIMRAELTAHVRARPRQRTKRRTGQRNGSYARNLLTTFGLIRMLSVPRPRQGRLPTRLFERYRRRHRAVDNFIRSIFLAGVSTRDTGRVLEDLLDKKVSASTVSEITKLLDKEVSRFHRRTLTDDYTLLLLDGVWVKVNGYRVVKKVVLVVYGVRPDGRREVIDFRQARSESTAEWESFLNSLYRRGLKGERLELVTVDGGKGLLAAQEAVYPDVPRQRCWVHKLRNVAQRLPARYREACLAGAKRIYRAKSYRAALKRCRCWAEQWRGRAPKAVACLEADIEELLTHMRVFRKEPKLWVKVRTTNAIERVFRELRKRIRPMCSFADPECCNRIVYGLFMLYNKKWEDRRLWQPRLLTQNS